MHRQEIKPTATSLSHSCPSHPQAILWTRDVHPNFHFAFIRPALLSRFKAMHFPRPGPERFATVAANVRNVLTRRHTVDPRLLSAFTGEDLEFVRSRCRLARDVRCVTEEIVSLRHGRSLLQFQGFISYQFSVR